MLSEQLHSFNINQSIDLIRSKSTEDCSVAVTDDHTSTIKRAGNEVLDVKIYEDSDIHSNVAELGTLL